MVVIFLPATALTGMTQERTAAPSMCTVQAPHWATPQPYLVPVRPTCSRMTQSSGVLGSTSTLLGLAVDRQADHSDSPSSSDAAQSLSRNTVVL